MLYSNDNATTVKSISFEAAKALATNRRFGAQLAFSACTVPTEAAPWIFQDSNTRVHWCLGSSIAVVQQNVPGSILVSWESRGNFKGEAKHHHCRVKMLFDCLKLQRVPHPTRQTHTIIRTRNQRCANVSQKETNGGVCRKMYEKERHIGGEETPSWLPITGCCENFNNMLHDKGFRCAFRALSTHFVIISTTFLLQLLSVEKVLCEFFRVTCHSYPTGMMSLLHEGNGHSSEMFTVTLKQ